MDPSGYKKYTTSRGLTYNYYAAKASPGKPTLVFVHGWPSSSWDWRKQVAFFQPKGYGLIVPDMLGYSGTDKPTDPKLYVGSALAQDVMNIMDNEGVGKAVLVGHDWGSKIVSRINFHPDRVLAVAFLVVGYIAPSPDVDTEGFFAFIRETFGRDLYGYWRWFAEDGADKTMEKNFDALYSLIFPEPPTLWREVVAPVGGVKAWVEGNKQGPPPKYLTPDVKEHYKQSLLSGGLAAPLCYYRVQMQGLNTEDDKLVPQDAYDIKVPCFLGYAAEDYCSIPELVIPQTKPHVKGPFTVKEFASDHWITHSHSPQLNARCWSEALAL
ncbi:hypothetical protein EWM64_g5874 [Hericium alpestre]|uniref:AB hydrolase-1 domain-containing protein n=1 Tax=Hericium alpestre TaxID=135208 RepID=A0A4Y9ZXC6_9AGAM|nr:hypothetical protein EWM64_g5874 [Hericium alpestre]